MHGPLTVLVVQPRARHSADEELRAVGGRPCVGHAQQARGVVVQLEVLVLKCGAIDALPSRPITRCEVPALSSRASSVLTPGYLYTAGGCCFCGLSTTELCRSEHLVYAAAGADLPPVLATLPLHSDCLLCACTSPHPHPQRRCIALY